MQSTTRPKQVTWDPAGSNRFIVGGGADLRLMEWEHTKSISRFNTVAACTDLGQLRSFAWSPHANYADLVAVGSHAGRILLLRLDSSPVASRVTNGNHQNATQAPSALQINLRHSRPCNVVTFCHDRPGLLAVGLEKGRGESLLLYDVEHSARALESGKEPHLTSRRSHSIQRDRGVSPAQPASSALIEPMPLFSFGSSESVSSAAFLYADSSGSATSPLLVAGMAGKWLRVYDIRSPPSTAATWGTRAVQSLAPNPFSGNQFVSAGEDGVVRLWDLRKPMDALLSWSEIDAGAVSARQRPSLVARGIVEMEWSATTSGVLTTLERDSHSLRVWQLADGPSAIQLQQMHGIGGRAAGTNAQGVLGMEGGEVPGSDSIRLPVLYEDRRPRSFQSPLASFACAVSPMFPNRTHFLGVSRDTTTPGNSGHRLEIIQMASYPHAAFLEDGMLLSGDESLRTVRVGAAPVRSSTEDDADESPTRKVTSMLNRGRTLSLMGIVQAIDRNETPRPGALNGGSPAGVSGSVTPRRLSRTRDEATTAFELMNLEGLDALHNDISMMYRERIAQGYGAEPMLNASLSDASLSEFWSWIARAESLARDGLIQDYDFRFRGVLSILSGFPSSSSAAATAASTPSHSPSNSTSSQNPTSHTSSRSIYSEFHRSLRERRDDHSSSSSPKASAAGFVAAAGLLVSRRKLDAMGPISSSSFSSQRKLAMQCCGSDWEQAAESVCQRYEKREEYEKAARHAFFSGHLESAMGYLRGCEDETLRVLAPLLAAYIAQKDVKGSDGAFAKLCRTLSSDAEKPWVRALFAFLASGDEWRELVDETGLPLKDRVAVALRFLPDGELLPFLQSLAAEARATGDLEAVVLFGLRDSGGISLLSSYVDRTSDLQTVALAASFISPGLRRNDRQLRRWIESYRSHLDRLQLFAPRALFDSARGRRARAAAEQARLGGRTLEANEVEATLRKLAPAQIVIRCQYCATNLGPHPAGNVGGEGRIVGPIGVRSTVCPTCSKGLSGCAVCLKKPDLHSVSSDVSSSLCWCQRCRHGGHVHHILEWFDRNTVCPVADCDCQCRAGDEDD